MAARHTVPPSFSPRRGGLAERESCQLHVTGLWSPQDQGVRPNSKIKHLPVKHLPKGFWKMFSWLWDIINNSKLLMSSSAQPLSSLYNTIQIIDSLVLNVWKQPGSWVDFQRETILYQKETTSIEANFTSAALWRYGPIIMSHEMRAKIENGSVCLLQWCYVRLQLVLSSIHVSAKMVI